MATIESLILGSEKLVEIFGRWPSFHDAEVIEFCLFRSAPGTEREPGEPHITAKIYLWEMTSEVDSKGYYVNRKHTMVAFRFAGVEDLEMEGFNHQNALFGLTVQSIEKPQAKTKFHVEFDPSFGIDSVFNCSSIEVLDAKLIPDIGPEP